MHGALRPEADGLRRVPLQHGVHAGTGALADLQASVGTRVNWPQQPDVVPGERAGEVRRQLPAAQGHAAHGPLPLQGEVDARLPGGAVELHFRHVQVEGHAPTCTVQHGLQGAGVQGRTLHRQVFPVEPHGEARAGVGQRALNLNAAAPVNVGVQTEGLLQVTRLLKCQIRARGPYLRHQAARLHVSAEILRQHTHERREAGRYRAAQRGQHLHTPFQRPGRQRRQGAPTTCQRQFARLSPGGLRLQSVCKRGASAPVPALVHESGDVGPCAGQRSRDRQRLGRDQQAQLRGTEALRFQVHLPAQVRHAAGRLRGEVRPLDAYVQVADGGGQGQAPTGDDLVAGDVPRGANPPVRRDDVEWPGLQRPAENAVTGGQIPVQGLPCQRQALRGHIEVVEAVQDHASLSAPRVAHQHRAARVRAGALHVPVHDQGALAGHGEGAVHVDVVAPGGKRGGSGAAQALAVGQQDVQAVPGATGRDAVLIQHTAHVHRAPEARPPGGAAPHPAVLPEGGQGLRSGHAGQARRAVVGGAQVAPGSAGAEGRRQGAANVDGLRRQADPAERQFPSAPGHAGSQGTVRAADHDVQLLLLVGDGAARLHVRVHLPGHAGGGPLAVHVRQGSGQVGQHTPESVRTRGPRERSPDVRTGGHHVHSGRAVPPREVQIQRAAQVFQR